MHAGPDVTPWGLPSTLGGYLVAGVLGIGLGWAAHGYVQDADRVNQLETEAKKVADNAQRANAAGAGFETDKANNGARHDAVTVEVEKIVDRTVYRNVCLDDDGLRILNGQIERAARAPQPGPGLP